MNILLPKFRFVVLVFLLFIFSGKVVAQCSITTSTNASSLNYCGSATPSTCNGVLYIGDGINAMTLTMNDDLDLTCLGAIQLIVRKATIDFSTANKRLYLAAGSSIAFIDGGTLNPPGGNGGGCTGNDRVYIGGVLLATCQGGAGILGFDDLINQGGYSPISAVSSPTSVCGSGSFTLTATATPASGATYKWYNAQSGGTLLYTGNPYVTPVISSTTTYYVLAEYSTYNTVRTAVTATVNPSPNAPSVSITQPTCSTATGTVTITAVAGETYSFDSGTYSSTLVYSGLAAGSTHTVYAKNASGCISAVRNITIDAQPGVAYTPTVGAVTLPTFGNSDGSVVLNDLPAGSWTLTQVGPSGTTTLTGSGTSTTLTGLADGDYEFSVAGATTCISAFIPVSLITVPYTPSANSGSAATCTGFTANWNAVPTATNYLLDVSTVATFATFESGYHDLDIGNLTSYSVTGLAPGTYYYRIRAKNGTLITLYSNTVTYSTLIAPSISVQPVTPVSTCSGNGSQTISVTASGTGLNYVWRKGGLALVNGGGVGGQGTATLTLTSPLVGDAGNYDVIVSGTCAPSVTSSSVIVTVSPASVGGTVSGSTSKCTAANSTTLTLSGNIGSVLGWESSTDNFATAGTPIVNTTNSLTITNLISTSYYRAVVQSGSCAIAYSTVATIVTGAPLATAASAETCNGFTANWSQINGATTYLIDVSTDGFATFVAGYNGLDVGNNGSFVVTGLDPGTSYSYRIWSGLTCGIYDTPSNSISITTNASIAAPSATATSQPSCVVPTGTITITAPTGAGVTYSIDGSDYSNATGIFNFVSVGDYNVTAKNAGGCISPATLVSIIANSTTIWNGSSWDNGAPTLAKAAVIAGNYDTTSNPDIVACSLTINTGVTLTIRDTKFVTIQNHLTVNTGGILEIKNQGSLVMISDAGNVINNGTINVNKTTAPFERYDYTYWSSPLKVTTSIATTFPTWRRAYEFHPENFIDADDDGFDDNGNDWIRISAMATPGKGCIIMGPTTGTFPRTESVVFRGTVNNGVVSTTVRLSPGSDPDDDYNLVGNPYPSAISADDFILANISPGGSINQTIDGTLYFWTHKDDASVTNPGPDAYNYTADDYAMYNLSGGVGTGAGTGSPSGSVAPSGYIASGQGFLVGALVDNGTLTFNNSMRVGNLPNTQFFKTQSVKAKSKAIEKDRFWLNLQNANGMFSQQLVGYFEKATAGYDNGYDGLLSDAGNFVNFYSFIDDAAYKIQGREAFNADDQIRLGYFSSIAGTFNINIDSKEGVFNASETPIYLEDKVLGIIHDLKEGAYSFETEKGSFDDRFVLRYNNTDKTLGTDESKISENKIIVSVKERQLKINSFEETIDKVWIYDLLGRQIFTEEKVDNSEFVISNLVSAKQTLIVKVLLQNGQIYTDKVVY